MNDKNDWEELIDRHLRGELEIGRASCRERV